MDQRVFHVRRDGIDYMVIEKIIYDNNRVREEGIVFISTDRYLAEKEAARLTREAEDDAAKQ